MLKRLLFPSVKVFLRTAAAAALLANGPVQAETWEVRLSVELYGWLDQYSVGGDKAGAELCAPTSSTNVMTYLQNAYPDVFPANALTGSSYADWIATDTTLSGPDLMDSVDGTEEPNFVFGITTYITQTMGFTNVTFAGQYNFDEWDDSSHPIPDFVENALPTAGFIYQALSLGQGFIANLGYEGGGGHVIAVNGLEWDPTSQTGMLYFVDPLDPAHYDEAGHPKGPAKQTFGLLSLTDEGELELVYEQYHGDLPYDPENNYQPTAAVIRGALAIAPVPEPGTLALLVVTGVAILVPAMVRRRRALAAEFRTRSNFSWKMRQGCFPAGCEMVRSKV